MAKPVFVANKDAQVVVWNNAMERLTGINTKRAVGKKVWRVL